MGKGEYLERFLRDAGMDETNADAIRQLVVDDPASAAERIADLAPQEDPAKWEGMCALLELGSDGSSSTLRRWIDAHGESAVGMFWTVLHKPLDVSSGMQVYADLLETHDDALLAAAAAALGECGERAVHHAPQLRELIRYRRSPWTRAHGLRALGRIGASDPESIQLMSAAVREGTPDEQLYATAGLGALGPDAIDAIDAVCDALRAPDVYGSNAAAVALIRIDERTEAVGDALARALRDEKRADRYHDLLRAVGLLHAPSIEAATCIDTALESDDAELRACGVVAGYLASDDASILGDALLEADDCSPLHSVLSKWQVDVEPFAREILGLLSRRAKLEQAPVMSHEEFMELIMESRPSLGISRPVDNAPWLFDLALRLGERSRKASPYLERIATNEAEHEPTRAKALEAFETLRARSALE